LVPGEKKKGVFGIIKLAHKRRKEGEGDKKNWE